MNYRDFNAYKKDLKETLSSIQLNSCDFKKIDCSDNYKIQYCDICKLSSKIFRSIVKNVETVPINLKSALEEKDG